VSAFHVPNSQRALPMGSWLQAEPTCVSQVLADAVAPYAEDWTGNKVRSSAQGAVLEPMDCRKAHFGCPLDVEPMPRHCCPLIFRQGRTVLFVLPSPTTLSRYGVRDVGPGGKRGLWGWAPRALCIEPQEGYLKTWHHPAGWLPVGLPSWPHFH